MSLALLSGLTAVNTSTTTERYGSPAPGLPLIEVKTASYEAVISLQGAQLLEYKIGGRDLLWLSPLADFSPTQAIRGGIPVCAPWFGVHQQRPEMPKHGFVRNNLWELSHATQHGEQLTLTFSYRSSEADGLLFTHPFAMHMTLHFSETLSYEIDITNTGSSPMPFSWALHSYFAVESLNRVTVAGLNGAYYLDATQHFKRIQQSGALHFDGELDRVYQQTTTPQAIQLATHTVNISGKNCPSCIVWNPGKALATRMPDVGKHYAEYICVERGAAFADSWVLAPGETQKANMMIEAL